jgi:hypothetical protein
MICLGDKHVDIKVPFTFIGFLCQYVSRMRMTALDLASRGGSEPFRCAFMCF